MASALSGVKRYEKRAFHTGNILEILNMLPMSLKVTVVKQSVVVAGVKRVHTPRRGVRSFSHRLGHDRLSAS